MKLPIAVLVLGCWPALCQIRDVVKSAEIDRMFGKKLPVEVLAKNNFAVEFRSGARGSDSEADEFWFVRGGSGTVRIGERSHTVTAGDVVRVARGTSYSADGALRYVAVRIFATERRLKIGQGAGPQARPMAEVVKSAEIDSTLAHADKNTVLHAEGALLINQVIYPGRPGPWEVHQTCDDLYFVRMGAARAKLDGTLIEGKEVEPGEVRGTGVRGAREFTIGPGDMVVMPRNTVHFMDPGGARLGYLLVKVCE